MRNLSSLIVLAALALAPAACATIGADDTTDASDDSTAAGKFDLWQANDGQWHFHLKSGNGSILLTSEAYSSRTGAINGVLSVETNGVDNAQYKVVPATSGYVIHLVAGNNEVISFSEVYSTKSNATRAVSSCVKAVTTYLDKHEAQTTGARVEVSQGDSGQWHFNMFAKNGEIVVASEHYTTEAAAYNGAFAVAHDGTSTAAYTVNATASGTGYYFVVTAQNGQIIGQSQVYSTKSAATAAVTATSKLMSTIAVF